MSMHQESFNDLKWRTTKIEHHPKVNAKVFVPQCIIKTQLFMLHLQINSSLKITNPHEPSKLCFVLAKLSSCKIES